MGAGLVAVVGGSADGDDVGAGEVGIDDGFVEVSGDGAVAVDAHDDVEVDEGVADLAGAGHLAGQVVLATRW